MGSEIRNVVRLPTINPHGRLRRELVDLRDRASMAAAECKVISDRLTELLGLVDAG